jgi:hypothetical protein
LISLCFNRCYGQKSLLLNPLLLNKEFASSRAAAPTTAVEPHRGEGKPLGFVPLVVRARAF